MKALQLTKIGLLELIETDQPEIKDDELLIRTGAATICTSDVNDLRENPFGIPLPMVIGHEGAGTVEKVGSKVFGFRVGDRVATHPVHPCGHCTPCQEGYGHLCLEMGHFGLNMPGTYAEFYRVRQDRARVLPAEVSFPVAALCEPVCVCLEALEQAFPDRTRAAAQNDLLILGDGPFGVLMARLAERLKPRYRLENVVIAGYFDYRLAHAGAIRKVNTRDLADPLSALLEANGGHPYRAAILAVGSRKALAEGLSCLKPRGRLVVFSALTGETPVDLFQLHLKELEIAGACSDLDQLDHALELLGDPNLGLAELITHQFKLEEYQEAFTLAEFGKDCALKVCFEFPNKIEK